MVNNLNGVSLGMLTFVLNIPFLLVGMRKLGAKFIVKEESGHKPCNRV